MPTLAYVDCFSGASGDMFLGALVDAGLPLDDLKTDLAGLHVDEFDLTAEPARRGGLAGTHVRVATRETHHHRGLAHITDLIEASALPDAVKERAVAVFRRLAEAEAAVHGEPIERVHFHEVGAVDAIVDIVGTCAGFARLGVKRIVASPVTVGSGEVQAAHGILPVPAPATAALLKGVPLRGIAEPGELTTPTGAALLVGLADAFGPMPAMRITSTGYGAGTRENETVPNLLRLCLGDPADAPADDDVWVVETNLDDVSGEIVGALFDRLFAAGAVDVFTTAVQMKKNRPGVLVTALAPAQAVADVERALFSETTTFGIRRHRANRRVLDREHVEVTVGGGAVRVKVGRLDGVVMSAAPEYEDCRRVAEAVGKPVKAVYAEAMAAYENRA